ncbi:hypothetical protein BC833DRAFT_589330 [Globomyces pollinis-pini]|nr:hypothetical protein BC833DRAFT_589330 [Globomyces pollinis-pini]
MLKQQLNASEKVDAVKALKYREPTTPPEGTRTTFFTALSTQSYQSVKSSKRKLLLEKYQNVKIFPEKVIIQDYIVDKEHIVYFTIQNLSKKLQYISLSTTNTKLFQLHKSISLDEFSISPGLEKQIKVVFNLASKDFNTNGTDPKSKLYLDRIEVVTRDGQKFAVVLEAYPPAAKLIIPNDLNFGTMVLDTLALESIKPHKLSTNDSIYRTSFVDNASIIPKTVEERNKSVENYWIAREIPLKNVGSRGAVFSCEYDHNLPIRITPKEGKLSAAESDNIDKSSCNIRIEFLPIYLGVFSAKIKIKIINDVPSVQKRMCQNSELIVNLHANVIDSTLRITTTAEEDLSNLKVLDFGKIHFGQKEFLPLRIHNQDTFRHRWVITQADQCIANVPSSLRVNNPDPENSNQTKNVITVFPQEGVLEPNDFATVTFMFHPQLLHSKTGFKCNSKPPEAKSYKLKMQLQLLADTDNPNSNKSKPLNMVLEGQAVPLMIKASKDIISFPKSFDLQAYEQDFFLENNNDVLCMNYNFEQVAHFFISPSKGILKEGERHRIKVHFKPNQYGHFNIKLKCVITGAVNAVDNSSKRYLSNDPLQILQLMLIGSSLPKSKPAPKKIFKTKSFPSVKESTDKPWLSENGLMQEEWDKKQTHQMKYIDYIRNEISHKPRVLDKIPSLKDAINPLDFFDGELKRINSIDKTNGLIPPEPTEHQYSAVKSKLSQKNNKEEESARALQVLYEKLAEPITHRVKTAEVQMNSYRWQDHTLTHIDLDHVYASTNVIQFNNITVHSKVRLPVNFLNLTTSKSPVNITLSIFQSENTNNCLDISSFKITPPSITLNHLDIAGFDIELLSHTKGSFEGLLKYVINKRYIYHIPVRANVNPIDIDCVQESLNLSLTNLDISKEDLSLIDSSPELVEKKLKSLTTSNIFVKVINDKNYIIPIVKKTIELYNNGQYEGWFQFTDSENSNAITVPDAKSIISSTEGYLKIFPEEGVIPPKSKLAITFIYLPWIKTSLEKTVKLSVYDKYLDEKIISRTKTIAVTADCIAADCSLLLNTKQGPIDFGMLPVSSNADLPQFYDPKLTQFCKNYSGKFPILGNKIAKIKNNGSNSCVFIAFSSNKDNEISITPHNGIIREGQTVELSITVSPKNVGTYEESISVAIVGGGKIFKIPIKYEGRRPIVELTRIGNDIGKEVIIGSSGSTLYQIANRGSVFARLIFNLTEFEDFFIQTKEDKSRAATAVSRIQSMDSRPSSGHTNRSNDRYISRLGYVTNDDVNGRKYRYCVFDSNPGDKISIEVIYKPVEITTYDKIMESFVLGASYPQNNTNSIPGFQTQNVTSTFEIPIFTKSIVSPVVISSNVVEFKDIIINQNMGYGYTKKVIATKNIVLKNTSEERVDWYVIIGSCDHVFSVEPLKGSLEPDVSQTLSINFDPARPGTYETNLNLILRLLDLESSLTVSLQATAVSPSIIFDPPEVFLPIVPMGVEATMVFYIINVGCDRDEVIPQIPTEVRRHDVTCELIFPEGKVLKNDGERLACIARFRVDPSPNFKSFSFNTKIPFETAQSRFYLPIHGTADMSNLTLQPYCWQNPLGSTQVTIEEKRYLSLNSPPPPRSLSGLIMEKAEDMQKVENFWISIGETLLIWLQDHLGIPMNEKDFPNVFSQSHGRVLGTLLQSLAGKKINGIPVVSKINISQDELIRNQYKFYQEVLTYLSMHGATLSSVKAEFLLSLDDFKRFNSIFSSVGRGGKRSNNDLNLSELYKKNFSTITKESWGLLLLQIVKIFCFSGDVKFDGGVKEDLELSANQTYSRFETLLLRWTTHYAQKKSGIPKTITSFKTGLDDSVIFANLILHFVPYMNDQFHGFLMKPATNDHRIENAKILIAVLRELFGQNFNSMTPSKIHSGSDLELQLLCLFLYQTLPHFVPKTVVEFSGLLHEKISRSIEISNATAKPMSYTAYITGSKQFTIAESVFTIPPKSVFHLQIDFVSRFSHENDAVLTIKSRKMCLNYSSIIVCHLLSDIDTNLPATVLHMEAPLYSSPPTVLVASISNPFNIQGEFRLHIQQKKKRIHNDDFSAKHDSFNPPAFTILSQSLVIPANGSADLEITYLPFELCPHECTILFNDPLVGEFLYKIDGVATTSSPIESCNWTCKSGVQFEKAIRIIPQNPNRDKAVNSYMSINYAYRNQVNKSRSVRDKIRSAGGLDREQFHLPRHPLKYTIEYTSPFFKGPEEIIIRPGTDSKDQNTLDQVYTELPISFLPKASGKYTCKVVLNCTEYSDIRVFQVIGMARSEGSRAELSFHTKAKQSIIQEIPILNPSTDDWPVKAHLQGQYFTGPFSINVKAGGVTNYPIVFQPPKHGEVNGVLILTNIQTTQKYTYILKGVAAEPDPEEILDVVCNARTTFSQNFVLKNTRDEPTLYEVCTDLPVYSGKKEVQLEPHSSITHSMKFLPLLSGKFEKFIKFFNQADESYLWYAINLQVNEPPAEYTIEMTCTVRKKVSVDIKLTNPLKNKSIKYSVVIVGNSLVGLHEVEIKAGEDFIYTLHYHPAVPTKTAGSIKFVNPEYGEFWYALLLQALDAPSIEMEEMTAPLGSFAFDLVPLSNPLNEEITLNVEISHSQNFQICVPPIPQDSIIRRQETKSQIILGPLESTNAQIIFWPTEISESSLSATIKLSSPLIGTIGFNLKGLGIAPPPMEVYTVESDIGEVKNGVVNFSNPYLEPISINLKLNQRESSEFVMVTSTKTKFLSELETHQIQILYKPTKMHESIGHILVETSKNTTWTIPLKGIPVQRINSAPYTIKGKAREAQTASADFNLIGLGEDFPKEELTKSLKVTWYQYFRMELIYHAKELSSKLFSLKIMDAYVNERGKMTLNVFMEYNPIKPLDEDLELVLTHLTLGGKWKFKIKLLAIPPPPDDSILIQGLANSTSSVSFTLNNPFDKNVSFQTYFFKNYTADLVVTPKDGTLVPGDSEQNEVTISYSPSGTAKTVQSLLVIETEEFCLFYDVKGVPPVTKRRK